MIRVAHIINSLNITGGAELLAKKTVEYLNKRGLVHADIFTLEPLKKETIDEINEYIPVFSFRRGIYNPLNVIDIGKICANYEIIHVHLFPSLYWAAMSKLLYKCNSKFIYTEHSTFNKRRYIKILKPIERILYNQYDVIIAISNGVKEQLLLWLGKNFEKKVTVIYNGIDLAQVKKAQKISVENFFRDNCNNCIFLIMVGSFTKQKDQETLIKALKRLDNKYRLILVGDGPKRKRLVKLAKKLDVIDRIKFTGILSQNDVYGVMKGSDIYVHSSNWEGFGLAVVEAMTCGLPVIASDVPGLREVINNIGLLFPKNNDKVLVEKISILTSDIDFCRELSRKSVSQAKYYSFGRYIENIEIIYKNVIKG